tara:strand:- start:1968 stop:2456 length:489 start_codon:yes stop_codon:yes gene_type:complete
MRKNIRLFGFFAIIALMISSCANQEKKEVIDMEKVKVEIQAMEDAFAAGEKAKDADAVAVYYSDDAISYINYAQPLEGKVAITEFIAKALAKDTIGNYNVYKVVDVFADGDMAVEIGSWTVFDVSGNEKDNGYYTAYFQKRDGSYECIRDMNMTPHSRKSGM